MKRAICFRLSSAAGFSLIELMMVVVVLGIFAALAGPSFSALIAAQRERAAASALYDSLMLARGEAVKRNTTVTLSSTDLAQGWTVILPNNSVLRSQEAFSGLVFTVSPSSAVFSYNFYGRRAGTSDTTVIISSTKTSTCWKVTVEASGRASVGQGCA
jgi:type IV fimbrial biogenesis protein FimT